MDNPVTRVEMYLSKMAGGSNEVPRPVTRLEKFLQAILDKIGSGGTGGQQVPADWNQNDSTAPDYVNNRTHYAVGHIETSVKLDNYEFIALDYDNKGEPIENGKISTSFAVGHMAGTEHKDLPSPGVKCLVRINGTVYESVCKADDRGLPCLGKPSIKDGVIEDETQPFYVHRVIGQEVIIFKVILLGDPGTYEFGIDYVEEDVKKLDVKFLPEPLVVNYFYDEPNYFEEIRMAWDTGRKVISAWGEECIAIDTYGKTATFITTEDSCFQRILVDFSGEEVSYHTVDVTPTFSPDDAGKFVRVSSDGTLVAESIPNAEEASF